MLPLVSDGANLINLCPFPDSPAWYAQHLVPIGPAVWPHFAGFWIVDPLKPPKCRRGVFPIGPAVWPHFAGFWIVDPLNPPPPPPPKCRRGVSWGEFILDYVHYQINPQSSTKFGANRSSRLTASPDISMCDPLNPHNALWGIVGRLVFIICPILDESADLNQSWCQSVQPF